MLILLPPAKMYDMNTFLELYSKDWIDDILLGFEACLSSI